jgi:two-component system cell cycle sensor histidine kinase/response regulator CckA
MQEMLHALFVEDSPEDVALVIRNLRLGGYHVESERVESATGLTAALDRQSWDIIICDYTLPSFSGFEALRILRERDQNTPFIFVSGSLGEDAAVSALKQGAQDYLLKDKLKRLVPAVEREIREARERTRVRAERARNESVLRASEIEAKQLESKFLQAQKMEAVGHLAGGIAHDFNNLLMIMGCSADLLQKNRLDGSKVDKFSQQIRDAVDKAARLTSQLLAFSRQQILQPSVLDLNGIINDLVKMMSRLLGEDIEIELTLDPGLGRVEVDRGHTEQVIMNLAVNARDAMPDGGKLTVTTANIDMDADHPDLQQMGLALGSYVMLSISDTGIGMSAETQSHMFEPFFTTKELGKGTGLGLSTVFGIVKQSNGAIWVQSAPGEGSAFHICLPRIQKPFVATTDVEGVAAVDGKETILLAEDDDVLRHLFVDYLRSKGYRVIEAVDGPHALHAYEEEEGVIHVLVTDMIMPGFGGHKLADLLLARCPDIPVIFLSGYTDRAANIQEFKFPSSFLQKPFSMDALARAVRTALKDQQG